MPLAPGTRLGSYEIVGALGAGGMGEVYRARDMKLGREVALKILPEAFASDPDRLMRFEREARTLAALNHPNIAQVYGVEESGQTRVLVMELVQGEDLSARIARGALPLDDALPLARQIAEALEAAHEAGIIHRDLKPANIKVRDDGTVKVLDFGLAKALESGAAGAAGAMGAVGADATGALESPTITSPALTMRGVILGTAAYMAPEQARGRPVAVGPARRFDGRLRRSTHTAVRQKRQPVRAVVRCRPFGARRRPGEGAPRRALQLAERPRWTRRSGRGRRFRLA